MNLSPHFTLEEFCASDIASRKGINNDLPIELYDTAKQTAELMERIRTHLSVHAGKPCPIYISSGYRSPLVNKAVGSLDTSDHRKAMAVDFKCPEFGSPLEICRALVPMVELLKIGQLIHEFGSWVHVSTRLPDKMINRILTIDATGVKVGI